jgi:hypothetical protein
MLTSKIYFEQKEWAIPLLHEITSSSLIKMIKLTKVVLLVSEGHFVYMSIHYNFLLFKHNCDMILKRKKR